jgi:hypothetical protein
MTPIAHPLFEQPWPDGEFRFFQLGFFVDDLVEAAERWATVFGVGPFTVLPRRTSRSTYRGQECEVESQIAAAQAGPVQIELIQQFDDNPSVYREVFPEGGSGLHQLCTVTDDYDGKRAHYEALGYEIMGEMERREHRVLYVDTVADFGFVTEVVANTPGFLEQLAAVARTCAEWDGTDPVRILTREGYRTPDRPA